MSAPTDLRIRGVSPEVLRRREREWWDSRYAFSCSCPEPRETREELGRVECAKCGRAVIERGAT